jgi:hypothetical protein
MKPVVMHLCIPKNFNLPSKEVIVKVGEPVQMRHGKLDFVVVASKCARQIESGAIDKKSDD